MSRVLRRLSRLSVRARLTLAYAGLFLLMGAVLLAVNYTLLARFLPDPGNAHMSNGSAFLGPTPQPAPSPSAFPPLGNAQQMVAVARDLRQETLRQLLIQSAVALVASGLIAAVLGWIMAGRVIAPVKTMTAKARDLSERNLQERFALTGPRDELKDLADTFDAMLGRLDSAFDSQRRFVANASHELRTPLAITRAAVEVQLQRNQPTATQWRETADRVLRSTERSERLIGSLLLLARIEQGSHRREPVDLTAVLGEAIDDIRAEAASAGIRLEASSATAHVTGDSDLLRRMIGNLLENAVRYNRRGGWLEVAVQVQDGNAHLIFRNSGGELHDETIAEIFEPFRRGTDPRIESTNGSGLGLSIVRSIAEAHGGSAAARPIPGGGLEVGVDLPLSST